jgi:hypothetical protein
VLLKEFWEKNKDKGKTESWGAGNTYTYVVKRLVVALGMELAYSLDSIPSSLTHTSLLVAYFTVTETTGSPRAKWCPSKTPHCGAAGPS